MAGFGDFYNKNKKKLSKEEQARKAAKSANSATPWSTSTPQVIGKGKKKEQSW